MQSQDRYAVARVSRSPVKMRFPVDEEDEITAKLINMGHALIDKSIKYGMWITHVGH